MNALAEYSFFAGPKPRIIGHRGAAGEAPENTLTSFNKALEAGAEFVELDVRTSQDGEVVIVHDARLERTTNGRGPVIKKTLQELKALDAGYWFGLTGGSYPYRRQKIEVPTLEEFLVSNSKAKAVIEIKQSRPPMVKSVIETVCRLGREKDILLATELDGIMVDIRKKLLKKNLKIASGFSYGEVAAFFYWVSGGKRGSFVPPGQALQIPCEYNGMTLVCEETVRAAHELGIEMFVWTINDTNEMERLLKLGVDGIITDYPSRLGELMSRYHGSQTRQENEK